MQFGGRVTHFAVLFWGSCRVQCCSEAFFLAVITGALPETRTSDSCRAMLADNLAGFILPKNVVNKKILGYRNVALHAKTFGDVGDTAGSLSRALCPPQHGHRRPHHSAHTF